MSIAGSWPVTVAVAGIVLCASRPARAGNDTYFVTYNSHIEKGEVELMLMNDFTWPASIRRQEDGQGNYLSNMVELEYGLTRQFATEFMLEGYEDLENRAGNFTGFRWESRYRIFEHAVPLNPMLYTEFEDLDPATRFKMELSGWVRPPYRQTTRETDRERVLEARLVLSQDFGPLNVAFDWINESDLNGVEPTAFGYAAGVRYEFGAGHGHNDEDGDDDDETVGESRPASASAEPSHPGAHTYSCPMHPEVKDSNPSRCPKCGMKLEPVGGAHRHNAEVAAGENAAGAHQPVVGIELYGGLGDSKSIGLRLSRQEHYLQPVMMLHLTHRMMFHVGLAIGLSKASDNLVRTALALEL